MRIILAVAVLGGLLVWEAIDGWTREKVRILLERMPELLVTITADFSAWAATMTQATEAIAKWGEWMREDEVTITRPGHPPQHLAGSAIDLSSWNLSWGMASVAPGRLMILSDGVEWTQAPDDSWVDAYSGRGEELETLEQVIEEQRERIRHIR